MNAVVASTNYSSFDPLTTADLCKTIMYLCKKRAWRGDNVICNARVHIGNSKAAVPSHSAQRGRVDISARYCKLLHAKGC